MGAPFECKSTLDKWGGNLYNRSMDISNSRIGEDTFKIEWSTKYEIGIPIIDEQHKKLVELVADFYNALMAPTTHKNEVASDTLAKALKDCCAYVQTHFRTEEELLQKASYPNFIAHKKEHDEFTAKVLETAKSFSKNNMLTAVKFARFLYDWILAHISHTDRLYLPYVNAYLAKK